MDAGIYFAHKYNIILQKLPLPTNANTELYVVFAGQQPAVVSCRELVRSFVEWSGRNNLLLKVKTKRWWLTFGGKKICDTAH